MRPPLLFIGSSFVHKTSNILCTLRYIIVFYCHECLGCICVVFLCYVDLFSPCGKIFLFLAPLPSCKVIRFANNDIAEIFPKTFLNYFSTIFLPSWERIFQHYTHERKSKWMLENALTTVKVLKNYPCVSKQIALCSFNLKPSLEESKYVCIYIHLFQVGKSVQHFYS